MCKCVKAHAHGFDYFWFDMENKVAKLTLSYNVSYVVNNLESGAWIIVLPKIEPLVYFILSSYLILNYAHSQI